MPFRRRPSVPAAAGLVALVPLALAGCGTIERGGTEEVAIVVHPATASVTTSRGERCEGSCVLVVPRSESFTATATAPGYAGRSVEVRSVASLDGMRSTATNAAGPGVVGVGVDLYTGAVYDHRPNPVSIRLEPVAPGPPAPAGPRLP